MNQKKIKLVLLACLMAVTAFSMTGCTNSNGPSTSGTAGSSNTDETESTSEGTDMLSQIKARGELVVATSGNYAPMTYVDSNGELTGIDIEIAKAVAEDLGVDITFVTGDISGLLPSLQTGKVDIICSSMTMTEERKEIIDFSEPYCLTNQVTVTLASNDSFQGPEDLNGLIVGVIKGTPAMSWLESQTGYQEIKEYPGNAEAFLDLKAGKMDVYIVSNIVASYYMKNDTSDNQLKIVGDPAVSVGTGIALRQGESELKAALDATITRLLEDGSIDQWGEEYLGTALPH